MSSEFCLSEKIVNVKSFTFGNKSKNYPYPMCREVDIKEFIKRDWVLTNHFLWDLLRETPVFKKLNLSDFWIEKMITKLKEKKDKLAGDKLT